MRDALRFAQGAPSSVLSTTKLQSKPASFRVFGYDVARSLAILGMVLVHFSLVMADDQTTPTWLARILSFLDGRAAATFVILAGVGITLMSQRAVASADADAIRQARATLVRRGLFLLLVGFINLAIWPGDILRVYGVSLLIASRLITASNRRLLIGAACFALGFVVVFLVVDFDKNWQWETLNYLGLWTPSGIVRNLFYDGFRSVLPWTGFVLFGMWLGRLNLASRPVNSRVLAAAAMLTIGIEVVSSLCVAYFLRHPHGMSADEIEALFGTQSMPALPLFVLAAGGAAVTVIAASVRLIEAFPGPGWNPLVATGQMALTWYFSHILFGLGGIVALGYESSTSLSVAAASGALFFAFAVLVSWLWKKRFRHGPLEWLMRTITN